VWRLRFAPRHTILNTLGAIEQAETIYSYVGLSERGNDVIGAMPQESYEGKMAR
jgi:hypothetical protein